MTAHELDALRKDFEAWILSETGVSIRPDDSGEYRIPGAYTLWRGAVWAHKRATEWRPMETAPRDETPMEAQK